MRMQQLTSTMIAFLIVAVCCFESVWLKNCSGNREMFTKPFTVVWNHPSFSCEDLGIHVDFEKWGILNNQRDRFIGDKIALFYHSYFGDWPAINTKNADYHFPEILESGDLDNGGVPQRADMDLHLSEVAKDIAKWIPDESFCGLGVIDQELWRPVWETNWSSFLKYKDLSIDTVKARHKNKLSTAQAKAIAEQEFNAAAQKMMVDTLKTVKKMRPNAKWGYYLFPQSWTKNNSYTMDRNNEHDYLWRESTAIYPSVYFFVDRDGYSVKESQDEIAREIAEAFRVRRRDSSPDVPIYVYTLSQNGPYHFYNESQLALSIGQPADMGVEGVIIWGASADLASYKGSRREACIELRDHTENVLGPYVQRLIKFFEECKEQHCNGKGRCVRKKYKRFYNHGLKECGEQLCDTGAVEISVLTEEKVAATNKFDDYVCK